MGRSEGRSIAPATLPDFLAWLAVAPVGTSLDARQLYETLEALSPISVAATEAPAIAPESTWRERLWVVPPETRLTVPDVAEALGRPKSFVYRHTQQNADADRLPHRKLDGELLFVAGEIRSWLRDHEETIEAGRMDRAPLTLTPRRAS